MKKLLLVLILLYTSYIAFGQTDSLIKEKPKYRFGVALGILTNTTSYYNVNNQNHLPNDESSISNVFSGDALYFNSLFTKATTAQIVLVNMMGQTVQNILPAQSIGAGQYQYRINRKNLHSCISIATKNR